MKISNMSKMRENNTMNEHIFSTQLNKCHDFYSSQYFYFFLIPESYFSLVAILGREENSVILSI